eukprot:3812-Chlamydomonas_euryale.AAC.1
MSGHAGCGGVERTRRASLFNYCELLGSSACAKRCKEQTQGEHTGNPRASIWASQGRAYGQPKGEHMGKPRASI